MSDVPAAPPKAAQATKKSRWDQEAEPAHASARPTSESPPGAPAEPSEVTSEDFGGRHPPLLPKTKKKKPQSFCPHPLQSAPDASRDLSQTRKQEAEEEEDEGDEDESEEEEAAEEEEVRPPMDVFKAIFASSDDDDDAKSSSSSTEDDQAGSKEEAADEPAKKLFDVSSRAVATPSPPAGDFLSPRASALTSGYDRQPPKLQLKKQNGEHNPMKAKRFGGGGWT